MLFNFFKKRSEKQPQQQEDVDASICYSIRPGNKSPILNIEIGAYDDRSADAICKLLDVLSSDTFYLETVEMIKSCLVQDKQEDMLLQILTHIGNNAKTKIFTSYQKRLKEEPCIKPSDMLR